MTISYKVNNGFFTFTDAESEAIDQMVSNILMWHDAATPDQDAEGRVWYAYAQDLAKAVTSNLRAKGLHVDFRTVAAVIAVTSNNMPWDRQVRVTEPIVEAILRGEDPSKLGLGVMFSYLEKAVRIVNGDMTALSGPKVSVFYLNIIGDYSQVTVDRHAVRVSLNRYTDENTTNRWVRPESRTRMMQEAAYYIASRIIGEEPAIVQAITWTAYRYSASYKTELEASKAEKRAILAARKAAKAAK